MKPAITKNSTILLITIAGLAVLLSTFSYQYSVSTSDRIVDIASQEIRSNARIEVHDLSQILVNRLQTVDALLQTLADAPALQNNEYQRAFVITNYRQNYTRDLTDFYMWLDQNGRIVWISNMNSTMYQKYKGFDLSYRSYFNEPKDTHSVYYSSLIESNDNVPRLYISYPILGKRGPEYITNTNSNKVDNRSKSNDFKGTVIAAVKGVTIGDILKGQLLPQFNATIGLLDSNGIILYASNQSFVGQNIFGRGFQSMASSIVSPSSIKLLTQLLNDTLKSNNSGTADIFVQGRRNTIAYEPISIKGEHFLTLYITAPHNLANNVALAINQQKNFSTLTVIAIGAVALGGALLVLTWNKRLEGIVNERTQELSKANVLLTESNKQLAIANKQLKDQDKMQREFINVAAHELRTPIQPIITIAEVLKSKTKEKEQSELLDIQISNAKRFQRLSQDILDVSMIEGGLLKLNKKQIDLNDLIVDIVKDHRQQQRMQGSNSKLKLLYEPQPRSDLILVEADRERIAQVICNLLSNAIRFTKTGAITISLTVKDAKNGEKSSEVIACVRDTGPGIDPEIQSRLFSKFATSSFQGTGLGLYISKNIIEAHGGRIWALGNIDNGKGATFCFSLPLIEIHK